MYAWWTHMNIDWLWQPQIGWVETLLGVGVWREGEQQLHRNRNWHQIESKNKKVSRAESKSSDVDATVNVFSFYFYFLPIPKRVKERSCTRYDMIWWKGLFDDVELSRLQPDWDQIDGHLRTRMLLVTPAVLRWKLKVGSCTSCICICTCTL